MDCHKYLSRLQVYEKLATVASWNNWHTSAWVLKSPNLEKLGPGDKFAYTAPFVLGNVHSQVEESAQGKVEYYTPSAISRLFVISLHISIMYSRA